MITKSGFFAGIRNRILGGIIIVIPIGLTFWIGNFVFTHLTDWAITIIRDYHYSFLYNGNGDDAQKILWAWWTVRIASVLIILAGLFLIGALGRITIGKKMISLTDTIMRKLPMLNSVYATARQIWDAIWSTKNGMFNQVVMFEYPRKGIWVIGFLTNENQFENWELHDKSGEDLISVFLPTTPNPTSGFLLFVPRSDCQVLDMDVTEGMRLIISGGAVVNGNKVSLPTE